MPASIISVLPSSPYADVKEFIVDRQSVYPSHWFYKPIGMEVEITNKCNLKCAGCGQRDETIRPEDILNNSEYIDLINQAKEAGITACSITGGETLLFLERVKQIIFQVQGLDIFKVNTNGFRFVNDEITLKVLEELKKSGFGVKNTCIKPVLVISVGQQNENGMPLTNAVNLVSNFYNVFDYDQAICSVNITDKNIQRSMFWMKEFKKLYKSKTNTSLMEKQVPIRIFMLNNIPTLQRLGLVNKKIVPIKDLLLSYKNTYKSWKCLNLPPADVDDLTTLTPKCVLRPNGDLYSCPGYNYVHKIGNLKQESFKTILEKANKNPLLEAVFTKGLLGLLEYTKKFNNKIEKTKLSISYGPCDVCQLLSGEIRKHIAV